MKVWKIKPQRWRALSITAKFGAAFGLLLALIVLVAITSYVSLTLVRNETEGVLLTSTEIQRLVLEMDGGMEEARLLHRDFFWQYPEIGFEKARELYVQPCVQQITEVVTLSAELKRQLAESEVSDALRESDVNLNLYLSSAQRFSDTFLESVELVTRLAAPETGLQAQMAEHSASLRDILEIADEPDLMDFYGDMQSFEKDYWITRQRSFMQSAFNVAFRLGRAIENTPALEPDQKAQAQIHLDNYVSTAEEILELDVAIRSKFNDFALQAEAIDPISPELIALAKAEVEQARAQIKRTSLWATIILIVTALAGLLLAMIVARVLNHSITRNVVRLTESASELQAGNLDVRAQINSADELGQLAGSFNAMAARIGDLVGNLEQKVAERTSQLEERTAELQNANEELQKAKDQAEAANRAKSVFLANMSHELRTPLNAILGYAQILQRRPLEAEVIDNLRTVQQSGEHLLTLITDILDLAKIEAGRMELSPAPIHIPNFLEQVAGIIRSRARAKGLSFNFERPDTLPTWVEADETRLRQVLLNLLDNAVKFTEAGDVTFRVSSIKCQVSSGSEYMTPATGTVDAYKLCFEVEDSGPGIAPDQVERIFQPFEQAREVSRTEGTGLGLAISRQLVRLMGGELHVESPPSILPSVATGGEVKGGAGSVFWFEVALPVAEVAVEARSAQLRDRLITGYQGPRRKVLVVDDIPSNRAVLVDLLEPLGFEVVEAVDGQQAIHLAQEIGPDLILMDRWMPVLDGFEAARRMGQNPELQGTVVIAVSASVSAEDQAQSREVGIDAFLPKPVNWPNLAALLEEHLELAWEYQEQGSKGAGEQGEAFPSASPPPRAPAPLVPPPQEELAILQDLVRRGNMRRLRERAAHIETLGEQYVPFANKLRELAKDFEEQRIRALIKGYMEEDQ